MGRNKDLTEEERSFIVGMERGGLLVSNIAAKTKRPRGTIATILRRFRIRGNVQTAPRSGRPSVTTPRDERSLARLVREDCRATAKSLARRGSAVIQKKVSERTILEGDYIHLDILEDRLVRSFKLAAKMLISSLKYRFCAFDLQGVFNLLKSNCTFEEKIDGGEG